MFHRFTLRLCGLVLSIFSFLAAGTRIFAQEAVAPEATLGASLRSLASRAAVVFAGQVTSIERSGEVVLVHFRVDQPILGVAPNPYTVREWVGLSPLGESRYYPGLRAVVFLHAPSGAGFSSPVDGMEGLVPLLPQGADGEALLDARRLCSRLERKPGDLLSASAIALADAVAVVQGWQQPSWTEPVRRGLPVEAAPVASCGATCSLGAPHRLAPSLPKRLPLEPVASQPLSPAPPAGPRRPGPLPIPVPVDGPR